MADVKSYIDAKAKSATPSGLRYIYLGAQGIHEGSGTQSVPASSAATLIWQDSNYYSKVWYRKIIQNKGGQQIDLTPITPGFRVLATPDAPMPQASRDLKSYIDQILAPINGLQGMGIGTTRYEIDKDRDAGNIVLPSGAIIVDARYERGNQHSIIGYKFLYKIMADGTAVKLQYINASPGTNAKIAAPQAARDLKSYTLAKAAQKVRPIVDIALGAPINVTAPSNGATIRLGYFVTEHMFYDSATRAIRPLMYKLNGDTQWRLANNTPA